jgi:excisionase family DNA binding protein
VPTLYTAEEAAKALRVRKSWLERQAAARKVPFTMLGGRYRFTTEHLTQIVRIFESTPTRTAVPAGSPPVPSRSSRHGTTIRTTSEVAPLRPRPRDQTRVA